MSHLDPSAEIELICPKCGHEFTKAVREIQSEPKFACPNGCGQTFDANDLAAGLEEVDDAIAKLGRDIEDMFK